MRDLDNADAHYVDSTALFINMKPKGDTIVKPSEKMPFDELREKSDPARWQRTPSMEQSREVDA